jgi:hypothetical protein
VLVIVCMEKVCDTSKSLSDESSFWLADFFTDFFTDFPNGRTNSSKWATASVFTFPYIHRYIYDIRFGLTPGADFECNFFRGQLFFVEFSYGISSENFF